MVAGFVVLCFEFLDYFLLDFDSWIWIGFLGCGWDGYMGIGIGECD